MFCERRPSRFHSCCFAARAVTVGGGHMWRGERRQEAAPAPAPAAWGVFFFQLMGGFFFPARLADGALKFAARNVKLKVAVLVAKALEDDLRLLVCAQDHPRLAALPQQPPPCDALDHQHHHHNNNNININNNNTTTLHSTKSEQVVLLSNETPRPFAQGGRCPQRGWGVGGHSEVR